MARDPGAGMFEGDLTTMSLGHLLETLSSLRLRYEHGHWRFEDAVLIEEINEELGRRGIATDAAAMANLVSATVPRSGPMRR